MSEDPMSSAPTDPPDSGEKPPPGEAASGGAASGEAASSEDDAPLAKEGAVDPQRLLRIAGITREVLEEARRIRPEAGAVQHLRQVHGRISAELREALPRKLYEELDELTPDPDPGGATLEEMSIAHAEILGWLEGLFQGTQLALQLQAAQVMQERSRRPLPRSADETEPPDGRYL
ncbi:MAG: DUF2587 domain-containing protein [Actinobacteria bacterium]|nr:DUF2587 domain-containing protein [Actinomycetota bacterium]